MMVVHEDSEKPVEIAVIRKPLLEQKSYLIVQNHVKELSNTTQRTTKNRKRNNDKSSEGSGVQETIKKKRKSGRKLKKNEGASATSSDSDNTNNITQIDPIDVEELRTVYMKCKQVINRIETKYSHLLNIDCITESTFGKSKQKVYSETFEDECNCKSKKKIVFDDEGRQTTVDMPSEKHICVKKMKNVSNEANVPGRTIAVEYQDAELGLPDDLQELRELLHDPDIENTYRNRVLEKIRSLKQEYSNEIRFNRHILIEKLKSNPDEVFTFKGSNLSSIPGYS